LNKLSILLKINIIFICLLAFSIAKAQDASQPLLTALTQLTEADYAWIGAKIYQNEAASNPKYLTHWGKGEDFPSFGIAHFIWFPNISTLQGGTKKSPPPYQETFPAMFAFVSKKSPPPIWLQQLWKQSLQSSNQAFDAPWQTKVQFDAVQSSNNMQSLRQWLLNTQTHQARFIVKGFQQRWADETASLSTKRLERLNQRLNNMMAFKKGLFSVVDYFNFKGLGNNLKEQYQGQSWGLISILEGMPHVVFEEDDHKMLMAFIASAKKQLQQRTELAPKERNESRWLKGWFKRLDGYAK